MIWNQLAKAAGVDDFLVLNTLETPVKLVSCHLRPWFQDGSRINTLTEVRPESLSSMCLLVEGAPFPLLVVTAHDDSAWADVSETLAATSFGSRVVQVVRHGERLAADGQWVVEHKTLDESGSTLLTINAANTRTVYVDFPYSVPFRLNNPQSAANLIRLSVLHPDARRNSRLPSAIWLRIRGEGVQQGTLTIDLHPTSAGDGWYYRVDHPQLTVKEVPAPQSALTPALRNIAWVVDRTCPDWNHWSAALALAQEIPGASDNLFELNAMIRSGIRSAMQEVEWPSDARMQVVWFGDSPGREVSPLKGVPNASRCWGSAGESLGASDAAEAVSSLTYMPGYDVWDPLGEALALCVPWFQKRSSGTVVIVGNSPPRYTSQGPVREISTALGFATSHRETSAEWSRALAALASLGVGVYYVFLNLGEHRESEQTNFSAFDTLQQVVMQQLHVSLPGRLLQMPGTHEGVARGIGEVLNLAKHELGRSNVEVLYA